MEIYTTVDTEKTLLSWECFRFACKADPVLTSATCKNQNCGADVFHKFRELHCTIKYTIGKDLVIICFFIFNSNMLGFSAENNLQNSFEIFQNI